MWEKSRPGPGVGELWEEIQDSLAEAEAAAANHFPGHPNYVLEQLLYAILLCEADAFQQRHKGDVGTGLGWPMTWGRPNTWPGQGGPGDT